MTNTLRRCAAATLVLGAAAALAAGCATGGGGANAAARAEHPILAQRCGRCHAIPRPSTLPRDKWLAALERMKKRMDMPAADWDTLAALPTRDAP